MTTTLKTADDWDTWIMVIKSMATTSTTDVWEYIDPEAKEQPDLPKRHPTPTFKDLDPSFDESTTIAKLSKDHQSTLTLLLRFTNEQNSEITVKLAMLDAIKLHILKTTSTENLVFVKRCATGWDYLTSLKRVLAPTDHARKIAISKKYNDLRKISKSIDVERWLRNWEITYADAKDLGISEISGSKPQWDFITAISGLDESYASALELQLYQKEEEEGVVITIHRMVEGFRNHYRRKIAIHGSQRAAFPALGIAENPSSQDSGSKAESKENTPKNDPKGTKPTKRKCLCDEIHEYRDCHYISPATRPENWHPNHETVVKVREAALAKPTTRAGTNFVQYIQQRFNYDGISGTNVKAALYSAGSAAQSQLYDAWILDSGSDLHICNHPQRSNWKMTALATSTDQVVAGKEVYKIEAFGSVTLNVTADDGDGVITLSNVALIPGFMANLVSLNLLNKKDVHWSSRKPMEVTIADRHLCHLRQLNDHWIFDQTQPLGSHSAFTATGSYAPKKATFTELELHQILGHASSDPIQHVPETDITIDHSVLCPTTAECESCMLSKAQKIISRRPDREFASNGEMFFRIAWDLIEPSEVAYNGDRYFSHVHCLESDFTFSASYAKKRDSLTWLDRIVQLISTQFGKKVRRIMLDGETSLRKDFDAWIATKGILAERSAPYSPEQNGSAERSGGVIIIKARSFFVESNLPIRYWPLIMEAAVYAKNRTPLRKLGWKTPYELVYNTPPTYAHMHPYGCKAYTLIKNIPRTSKLLPRAHIGFLVGYSGRNIYKIWIPSIDEVIRTRDVKFDHNAFWKPEEIDVADQISQDEWDALREQLEILANRSDGLNDEEDTIVVDIGEGRTIDVVDETLQDSGSSDDSAISTNQNSQNNQKNTRMHNPIPTPSRTPTPNRSPEILPSTTVSESLRTESLSTPGFSEQIRPSWTRELIPETTIESQDDPVAPPRGSGSRQLMGIDAGNIITGSRRDLKNANFVSLSNASFFYSFITTTRKDMRRHRDQMPPPPLRFHQLRTHPYADGFTVAMKKEIDVLLNKGMFSYEDESLLPPGVIPLPLMWVFTDKYDEDGFHEKHKARIVARGDLYTSKEEVASTTLAAQTFKALISLAAAYDLEIKQYDVVNAYANADLDSPLWLKCPDGFSKPGKLLKAYKALYGMPKSGLLWQRTLSKMAVDLGLKPTHGTNCLFTNNWIFLVFYVDDILCLYHPQYTQRYRLWEAEMLTKFEFKQIGDAKFFLGVRITRDRDLKKIWLSQDGYIGKLQERFQIKGSKRIKTPLPPGDLFDYPGNASPSQITFYQEIVGSVTYASYITRPDVAKATSILAHFQVNPGPLHISAGQHCIGYLVTNRYLSIEFSGSIDIREIFLTASDAAFGDDVTTRRSSYGYAFKLFGGLIHWKAVLGKTVTTSSTEAELMAMSATAKEYIAWMRFFKMIRFTFEEIPVIYCDNKQTLRLLTTEAPKLNTALKHIDIHQNWLRQEVQEGRIKVDWVPTNEMVADGFTKMLPPQKHQEWLTLINLVDIGPTITRSTLTSKASKPA